MGIIDKIKEEARELVDRVSNKAEVRVELDIPKEEVFPGELLPFKVLLTAPGGHDIKIRRVFMYLREKETTNLGLSKTSQEEQEEGKTKKNQLVTLMDFEEEFPLREHMVVEGGKTEVINGEVIFPVDAEPTYVGRAVSHEWELELNVDVDGGTNLKGSRKIVVQSMAKEHYSQSEMGQMPPREEAPVEEPGNEVVEGTETPDLARETRPLEGTGTGVYAQGIPEEPGPMPYEPMPGGPSEPGEIPYMPQPDSPTTVPEPQDKQEQEWEFPGPGVKKEPRKLGPEQPDIGTQPTTPGGRRPLSDQDSEVSVPMAAEESLEKTGKEYVAGRAEERKTAGMEHEQEKGEMKEPVPPVGFAEVEEGVKPQGTQAQEPYREIPMMPRQKPDVGPEFEPTSPVRKQPDTEKEIPRAGEKPAEAYSKKLLEPVPMKKSMGVQGEVEGEFDMAGGQSDQLSKEEREGLRHLPENPQRRVAPDSVERGTPVNEYGH